MDTIKFIPKNQRNLEQLDELNSKSKDNTLIYILGGFFLVYIGIVGFVYWFFVVQEKAKITQAIEKLDNANSSYYITTDLDQGLFNIADLINNSYDSIEAIKSIESAYIPGSVVSQFSYDKVNKEISMAMSTSSFINATKQIDSFKALPLISNVTFSALSSDGSGKVSFTVQIKLK